MTYAESKQTPVTVNSKKLAGLSTQAHMEMDVETVGTEERVSGLYVTSPS